MRRDSDTVDTPYCAGTGFSRESAKNAARHRKGQGGHWTAVQCIHDTSHWHVIRANPAKTKRKRRIGRKQFARYAEA